MAQLNSQQRGLTAPTDEVPAKPADKPNINPADVIANHKFTYDGMMRDGESLAKDAIDIQAGTEDLAVDRESFGKQFMLLAQTCGNVAEFLTLLQAVEASQSWKSELNPKGTNQAPTVFKQYKSNMKVLWDKFKTPPTGIKTSFELNKAVNTKRKAAKTADNKAQSSEAVTSALVQSGEADNRLGNVLSAITQAFNGADEEVKTVILEELASVLELVKDSDEADKLAQHLEETQAA